MNKKSLAIICIVFTAINMTAMEVKRDKKLSWLIEEPPSLKFTTAWQIAKSGENITRMDVPEELFELISKLKTLRACRECTKLQKKLFINLINNPGVNIEINFPKLIKRYLGKKERYINKEQLLSKILVKALDEITTNWPLIALLIKEGANVNTQNTLGITTLMFAAGDNRPELLKLLLDKGADINAKDKDGDTALKYAQYRNNREIIGILKKAATSND